MLTHEMTLDEAVNQNCMRIVHKYIESGADPNVSADGLVPLRKACYKKNILMIKYLHGANPNLHDKECCNALFYVLAGTCLRKEILPRFKLFFKYGIDLSTPDKQGRNILQYNFIPVHPHYNT